MPDATLQQLYDMLKMGPDQRQLLARALRLHPHPEGKAKLRPALSSGNTEKTMTAPVTVIVAYDPNFYDKLPKLFPHAGREVLVHRQCAALADTAFRNGTLQGAYLMMAARAVGLDAGADERLRQRQGGRGLLRRAAAGSRTSWSTWAMAIPPACSPRCPRLDLRRGLPDGIGAAVARHAARDDGQAGIRPTGSAGSIAPLPAGRRRHPAGSRRPRSAAARRWTDRARSSGAGGRCASPACAW